MPQRQAVQYRAVAQPQRASRRSDEPGLGAKAPIPSHSRESQPPSRNKTETHSTPFIHDSDNFLLHYPNMGRIVAAVTYSMKPLEPVAEPRVEKTLENLLNEMPTVQGSKIAPSQEHMEAQSLRQKDRDGYPRPLFSHLKVP